MTEDDWAEGADESPACATKAATRPCAPRRRGRHCADDSAPARQDEMLHLHVDGRTLVVGGEAEVAAIAPDPLAPREGLADLRGRAAVHVNAVQDSDDHVAGVDRPAVPPADHLVQRPPCPKPAFVGRHGRDDLHVGRIPDGPRVDHLHAHAPKGRDQDAGVEAAASEKPSGPARYAIIVPAPSGDVVVKWVVGKFA